MNSRSLVAALGLLACIASPAALAIVFPTVANGDGTNSYRADVVRRVLPGGVLLSSASATYGGTAYAGAGAPANLNEGDDEFLQINATNIATATATVVMDLGEVYLLNKIQQRYRDGAANRAPTTYQLRVSPDNATWTTVVAPTAPPSGNFFNTFLPANVRYIEWTGTGIPVTNAGGPATPQISLDNLYAFVADSAPVPPDTGSGFDLAYLNGIVVSDLTPGQWNDAPGGGDLVDKGFTGASGKATSTANAAALIDLGAAYALYGMGLNFRLSQTWGNGGKIELSPDNLNFYTVLDQATNLSATDLLFSPIDARYIRLTNYYVPGVGTGSGRLDEVEIFALPEPGAALLLGAAGLLVSLRRRR